MQMVLRTGMDPKDIYHSNFFCFGEYDVYEYKKYELYNENNNYKICDRSLPCPLTHITDIYNLL